MPSYPNRGHGGQQSASNLRERLGETDYLNHMRQLGHNGGIRGGRPRKDVRKGEGIAKYIYENANKEERGLKVGGRLS